MQNKIQKLQTVNAELKTRLRMYETKSVSSKFQERNEIKMLQAKVEKLNTHNMELKVRGTNSGSLMIQISSPMFWVTNAR